ncbi:hypothetical protein Patl1_19874 [Pistacia atlantica]|uniref:Uncharacterized protein n=1 Tax=Pistacia atlantica TaxID=434234 RepID=A0ACC1BKR3_9ROSI|nr:hypothetical protein Patl1_19874 [Pistacia atlantica]
MAAAMEGIAILAFNCITQLLEASTILALASIGQGSYTLLATVGANQLDKPQQQGVLLNWFYFTICTSFVMGATAIVYIEENISWRIGFCVPKPRGTKNLKETLEQMVGVPNSLVILQALTMDRHFGPHFKLPAGSFPVVYLLSSAIGVTLIDRLFFPTWKKLTRRSPTPLQRIGAGHAIIVATMIVAALVEFKRFEIIHTHHLQDKPGGSTCANDGLCGYFHNLFWKALEKHFVLQGQIAFYYQEFPASLRSTATAMIALIAGISFYMRTAFYRPSPEGYDLATR